MVGGPRQRQRLRFGKRPSRRGRTGLGGEGEERPAEVGDEPSVLSKAVGPLTGACDDVEVLTKTEDVEHRAQHEDASMSGRWGTGDAVSRTSSKPCWRQSRSTPSSGMASVSTVTPMQHCDWYEKSVALRAAPM